MGADNATARILHIGKYFPPYKGGMETYLRDVMGALAQRDVDNRALVHQTHPGLKSREDTVTVRGKTLHVTRAAVWARLFFTPLSPTFPLLLNRMIREFKPDLLHLHLPNASAFWALLLPRARRIPWTVHWHSDVPVSEHSRALRWFYALYRPFERAVLKRAARIVTTSPPYLASSEPLADFRDKCTVVPLGIDPSHLGEPAPSASGNPGQLRVLAIGRLTYYKGFEYLLRAAALEPSVRVELVGTGDLEGPLRRLAATLGIGDRVAFLGHVPAENLPGLLAGCDCLCLPSIERSEAFGLVLLEAMYHGKATVASAVSGSGMGWVVTAGETGLLVPPGDAESLATALGQLSRDRGILMRFGTAGRERFDQHFHIDRSAGALLGEFEDVLHDKRPGQP